ncbi:squalene monooxygenase [Actinoplanes sp. NPDC049265]|uniref:squalene monooxygenase n=1 Tax=Actinoplanes sp. NPDC049265 TaxID=3363902 RepID=UPI003718C08E
MPDTAAPRRGVPQGRQLHVLLARGSEALEELFPGLGTELAAAGAHRVDIFHGTRYYVDGRPVPAAEPGVLGWGVTRPALEHVIRAWTGRPPGVRVVHGEAIGLTAAAGAITGVRTPHGDLPADLVVDAAGTGSRARAWLAGHGAGEPEVSRVRANVVYVTRFCHRRPGQLAGLDGLVIVPFPGCPRGAAVMRVEDERWAVVLFGLLGTEPPADERGMLAYAESLPVPDVADLLRAAEPVGAAVKMRYPASERWHFERQRSHLDGHLVVGDALCHFNPTYGQGISVAAMEALALRRLAATPGPGLPGRFYRAAARIVDDAWILAAGSDLRFPGVTGPRGRADRVIGRYLDRYRAAAWSDPVLARTFLRVANMLDPASAMLAPGHVARVLTARGRSRPT